MSYGEEEVRCVSGVRFRFFFGFIRFFYGSRFWGVRELFRVVFFGLWFLVVFNFMLEVCLRGGAGYRSLCDFVFCFS